MIEKMDKGSHKKGFSLIETVLSISIFLVTIMILLAMLGPVLSSLDEVTEADEISSIVESLNSYLQGNSSLAVNGSNFDVIYEAVKSRGYATVYIFRSYVSENSPNIQLSIGFSAKETTKSIRMNRRAKIYNFKNSAGPIYRAIITSAPHMPKQYYRDRGRSANPRYYLVADRNSFKNNYLPLEISLYLNNYGIEFLDTIQLKDILKDEPVIKYFTVINR